MEGTDGRSLSQSRTRTGTNSPTFANLPSSTSSAREIRHVSSTPRQQHPTGAASVEVDDPPPDSAGAVGPSAQRGRGAQSPPLATAPGNRSPNLPSRASPCADDEPTPDSTARPPLGDVKALLTGRHAVRDAHASRGLSWDDSARSDSVPSKGHVDSESTGTNTDSSAILRAVHAVQQQPEQGDTSGSGSPPENLSTVREENPSEIASLSGFNTSTNGRSGRPGSLPGDASGYDAAAGESSLALRDSVGHSSSHVNGAKQCDSLRTPPGSFDARFSSSRTQGGVVTVGVHPHRICTCRATANLV